MFQVFDWWKLNALNGLHKRKKVSSNKNSKLCPPSLYVHMTSWQSPFLTWRTLHSNTKNLNDPMDIHFIGEHSGVMFYIASQLLIHFKFPTWQGWLQIVQSFGFWCFLRACGWAPLLSNFWDEKQACEPKGRKGKRLVASTSQYRTVVVTFLNSIPLGQTKPSWQFDVWKEPCILRLFPSKNPRLGHLWNQETALVSLQG